MATDNEGLTIFAIGEKSKVIKNILTDILEQDTPVKGVVLAQADDADIKGLDKIYSEHTTLMLESKLGENGAVKLFGGYAEDNKKAMRRSPDLVLMGDIYEELKINNAIEQSLTGHRVFGRTKARNIGSVLVGLVHLFPSEQQPLKCYDLINSTNGLVYEADGQTQVLIFDRDIKARLCSLIKSGGFDAHIIEEAIINEFLSQQAE